MGEIRSALDIALEKAARLGKMTAEELRRQQQEKLDRIAGALIARYAITRPGQLGIEIDKHPEQERRQLRRAALALLLAEVDLAEPARARKILQAISPLGEGQDADSFCQEANTIISEYEEAARGLSREIERQGRDVLHQRRISGSALRSVNPNARTVWQQSRDELARPFAGRLETARAALAATLHDQ